MQPFLVPSKDAHTTGNGSNAGSSPSLGTMAHQLASSSSLGGVQRGASRDGGSHGVNRPTLAAADSSAIRELEFDGKLATAGGANKRGDYEEDVVHSIASMKHGLETGSDTQRSLILFEIQQLVSHCKEYAVDTLIPVICENVHTWSVEVQVCAAEALNGIVSGKATPGLAKSISDTAFQVLRNKADAEMFRAWGEVLVALLPYANWKSADLEQLLIRLENEKDTSDGQNLSRKLMARILGPIALSVSPDLAQIALLPRALALASRYKSHVDIRGMVVESLALIATRIETDTVERAVWPCIQDLLKDSDARLHAATLRTISRIAAAHRPKKPSASLFRDLLPPVFIRECQYLRKAAAQDQRLVDDSTYLLLEINAEIFGELFYSSHMFLSEDAARKEAFRAFQAMCTCNGPVVRRHCAYNMPGVASSMVKFNRSDMAGLVDFLSQDTDAETRWNLAAGMHETAKVLIATDTMDPLFKATNALLHDESPLVRMNVLQNLDNLLGTLASHNPYRAMRRLETVFQNLQLLSEGNWRTQQLLAQQLRAVAPLIPPPSIRDNVLPLLYQLTDESSYTVRKASMAAVAVCIRCIPDTSDREEAMQTFRHEWGRGVAFWMRIGFVDSAEAAVATYSRCLFRDTFATELLKLAHDPVPNVRLRTAMLMAKIAPACHQMEEYQAALSGLADDQDSDVLEQVKDIETRIQTMLDEGKKSFETDMAREEEEQELYKKHLQLQAEMNKRRTGVKERTNALLGRAKGRNSSVALASSATDSGNSPSTRGALHSPGNAAPQSPTQGRSSARSSRSTPRSLSSPRSPTPRSGTPRAGTPRGDFQTTSGSSSQPFSETTSAGTPRGLPRGASWSGRSGRKLGSLPSLPTDATSGRSGRTNSNAPESGSPSTEKPRLPRGASMTSGIGLPRGSSMSSGIGLPRGSSMSSGIGLPRGSSMSSGIGLPRGSSMSGGIGLPRGASLSSGIGNPKTPPATRRTNPRGSPESDAFPRSGSQKMTLPRAASLTGRRGGKMFTDPDQAPLSGGRKAARTATVLSPVSVSAADVVTEIDEPVDIEKESRSRGKRGAKLTPRIRSPRVAMPLK